MKDDILINDDCISAMRRLANAGIKVDLVLTDPPYGKTACKWDTVIPFDSMWKCLNDITYDDTPILLFGTEPFSSMLRMSNIKQFRYDWIWHKNTTGDFALARKRPMKYHEIISVFYRKQPTYNPQFQEYSEGTKARFKDGEAVNKTKQLENSTNKIHDGLVLEHKGFDYGRGKYPESVQFFKGVSNSGGRRFHPSQKPVPLLEYLVRTYTVEGDTVLDFTMGSGSTGVACNGLNRRFIGIELDEEYYGIARKRLYEID